MIIQSTEGPPVDAQTAFHAPDIQTMSAAERTALQDERLAEVSARAGAVPIPFVRRRLEAAGIGPGELSTENLASVAVVTKDDLRASEREHPPFGDYRGAAVHDCVRVAQTSGTTGDPTVVFWTRRDLDVEYDAYARNQWRQGYRPGETILVTAHPGYLNGGEPMVRAAAEAYGILCVSVGPPTDDESVARALRLWSLLRPNRYVLLGPSHQRFYEAALAAGYDDPEAQLGLPPPEEQVTFQWRQISAGQEAFAYLGTECSQGAGAHLNEDYAVVEVLDPVTREPVPSGARGHLVVTTLARDNVVVRHDTEDLVRLVDEPCACGETTRRAYWDGRDKDVVDVDGTSVLPIDVAVVLADDEELGRPAPVFQLVRRRGGNGRLEVRAEGQGDGIAATRDLEARLGVGVDLTVVEPGTLPRLAYKPVPVVDEP